MGKDLNGKDLGNGIVQKKNGRYEARFNNRFGKRISISGYDLKDVKRRFNEAIYDDQKEINIRDKIRLDDWYEKWIGIYKFDAVRPNTKRHYNQIYKTHIKPTLGRSYLKDITQLQIRELLKKLKKNGLGFETRNKVKILLVDMFNRAMLDEFVTRNPAKGITVKRDEEKEIRVLSVEEQADFFDCCKGTFYNNLFVVAVQSGLRIGELAALRKEDIDFEKGIIHVSRTLVYQKYEEDECKTFHFEDPKTRTSLRDVPINKQCEIALKRQVMQKKVVESKAPKSKKPSDEFCDLLFTTKYNTPLNTQIVSDAILRIVEEVNSTRDALEEYETFSCHCFRHTFATRCFEAGIQPKTVQKYLGHATLQMTMDLYTSVLKDHMISEMDKLNEMSDKIESYSDENAEEKYQKMVEKTANNIVFFGDCVGYK